jgi:hypothetical protein
LEGLSPNPIFIIGFLFHGPLFGKLWMRLADVHPTGEEKLSDMWVQMLLNLLANIVTAGVIALIFLGYLCIAAHGAEHGEQCRPRRNLGRVDLARLRRYRIFNGRDLDEALGQTLAV